jgi:peptidoglycan/LPS O-acetylase OafA/YrhL
MGAIRLFLAYVVLADHWRAFAIVPAGQRLPDWVKLGFNAGYAVMFFYVISGFLITYTLSKNYEATAAGAGRFYANRFVRIFSLYWPVVALTLLALPPALADFMKAGIVDKFTGLFLFGVDWRVSFGSPKGQYFDATIVALRQAWTLGAELTFYVMAPFLMRSWKAAAALLCASLGLRFVFVATTGAVLHDTWTYTFFPSTVCFFLLGHLSMRASVRWPRLAEPALGLSFSAIALLVMMFGSRAGFDSPRFWVSTFLFAGGMPGMFAATKNSAWLNRLGDLSYPLYLVHILVFVFIGSHILEVARIFSGGMTQFSAVYTLVIFASLALTAAIVAHYVVEWPTAFTMRAAFGIVAKLVRRKPAAAV